MIPLFKVHIPPDIDRPLLDVLHSGWIGQGKKVDEFEAALSERLRVPNILTLVNGTAGLHLALRLSGIGAGDEVITTPMTCTATTMPILAAGAMPVWADINPETGNIDPGSIRDRLTKRTKAILCVHWGGYPCDLDEIHDIARSANLRVIEDAAHALGAEYKGKMIGSHSDFVMFSFQAIKHITTVDGGALCCKSRDDYARGKLLRWYGINRESSRLDLRCEDDITEWGYKFHMNDVAATMGLVQLPYLSQILERHRANAAYYDAEFEARGIVSAQPLRYQKDRRSAYWLYTVLVDDRDGFIEHMKSRGVAVSRAHVRNDIHSCFAMCRQDGLTGVDYFDEHQVAIPVHWALSPEDRETVMNAIEEWDNNVLS